MLIEIHPESPNPRQIQQAVEVLRKGGVVIYPTDTIYGIGCDIFNPKAVERVCKFKGINPQKNNLSIICQNISQISKYAKVSQRIFELLKNNLPGAFTFLLNVSSQLPAVFKNRKVVGVRIPDNRIVADLVAELGNPILTTSIHFDDEMMEDYTDPELIDEKYRDVVDLVINGGYGNCEPSTVVDCTTDEPVIKRQGLGVLK
ncbi:MAG: threonylcarbamoyl-AMP synthase [Prevotellaceae bacterium]|jgi:tRNA threonylcarbamoyl adenosine modification protein (Sua5/YciO/YrdC/YwlC family)|nr:threonylcarbamoyl-AMP synthase [Prevotellaceae bacterium]